MPENSNLKTNSEKQCAFDAHVQTYDPDATSNLRAEVYDQIRKETVKISGDRGVASGVIWKSDQVITDLHVPASLGKTLKVETASGHSYYATVENIDAANDLASLRVPGLSSENLPNVADHIASSVKLGDDIVSMGNPVFKSIPEMYTHRTGTGWFATCTAEGKITPSKTVMDIEKMSAPQQVSDMIGLMRSLPYAPVAVGLISQEQDSYADLAKRVVNRSMVSTDSPGVPGISGGPLSNRNGEFVGLNDLFDPRINLYATPASVVADFAGQKPRFKFSYATSLVANGEAKPTLTGVESIDPKDEAEARLAKALLGVL